MGDVMKKRIGIICMAVCVFGQMCIRDSFEINAHQLYGIEGFSGGIRDGSNYPALNALV